MWFPIDQPWYWERDPEAHERAKRRGELRDWGRIDNLPGFPYELDRWFTELPENFDDDLHTKPEAHRRWMTSWLAAGTNVVIADDDTDMWLRQLDYYVKLHELSDQSVGMLLAAMDDIAGWDDTIVIFTSDHGDQCGSHRLRSKGPWNYQETMRIPLYVNAPGMTRPGTTTDALTCHIDLARTVAELGGVDVGDTPTLRGESLAPIFSDQSAAIRDHVLFSQEWPWYPRRRAHAVRELGDLRRPVQVLPLLRHRRRHDACGAAMAGDGMLFGRDAAFDDHDHELYDLQEDPHELVNLALDRGRRADVRSRFGELRAMEHEVYANGY